nr:T-lymphocyte surface antigen Ly-9-like [Paramormyrops kingsleyae]
MENKLSSATSVDIRTSAKETQPLDGEDVQMIHSDVAVVKAQEVRCRVAPDTPKTIYGFINESVILPSGSPVLNPTQIQWHHNNRFIILYVHPNEVSNHNKNKFWLNKTDGSLRISNLHTEDSGNYKVKIIIEKSQKPKELNLIVVGRIKKPELKVLNARRRTGFCLVKVSCITFDDHSVEAECNITSDTSSCTETRNSSSPGLSIDISAQAKLISCNSSNIVTSFSRSIVINEHCAIDLKGLTNGTQCTTCIFLVYLLIVLLALFF